MGSRARLLAAVWGVGCSFSAAGAGEGHDTGDDTNSTGPMVMTTLSGPDGPDTGDADGTSDDTTTAGDDATVTTTDDDATSSADTGSTTSTELQWAFKRHIDWSDAALAIDEEVFVPVLLRLDASVIDYGAMAPDGADLRIYNEAEDTLLAYDIEQWDPDGNSLVWVLVPDKPNGSGDGFWMYYGSPDAPSGEDEVATWTDGPGPFVGVWHMTEDPDATAPQFVDVTGHGHDGTAVGIDGGAVEAAPQFGPAIAFDGTEGPTIEVPDHDDFTLADGFLVEALVRVDTITNDQFRSAVRKEDAWILNVLEMGYAGPRAVVIQGMTPFIVNAALLDPPGVHYVAMTLSYDAMNQARLAVFVDGVETATMGSFVPSDSSDPLRLGWRLPGAIFEARVSATPRRMRFLQLQWLGWQGDLVVIGAEEPA